MAKINKFRESALRLAGYLTFFGLAPFYLSREISENKPRTNHKKNQLNTPLDACWFGQIKECFESPPIATCRRSRVAPQRCPLPPASDAKLIIIPGVLIIMPKTLYIVNTRPWILTRGAFMNQATRALFRQNKVQHYRGREAAAHNHTPG